MLRCEQPESELRKNSSITPAASGPIDKLWARHGVKILVN